MYILLHMFCRTHTYIVYSQRWYSRVHLSSPPSNSRPIRIDARSRISLATVLLCFTCWFCSAKATDRSDDMIWAKFLASGVRAKASCEPSSSNKVSSRINLVDVKNPFNLGTRLRSISSRKSSIQAVGTASAS